MARIEAHKYSHMAITQQRAHPKKLSDGKKTYGTMCGPWAYLQGTRQRAQPNTHFATG